MQPARVLSTIFLLTASSAGARAQRPPLDQATLVARLSATLDTLSARDEFSGVVVLTRAGSPVFQHAYGYADRATKRPNRLDTAFNLGSINKLFTMAAIRQLAGAGKLDLDSTLGKYWPDYPNADARRVTIRQLLTMSSGIGGNIFGAPPGGTRHDVRRNRDYLPLFVNEPLQFQPGTKRQYSNAGFVVLGLLVERLSGEDYYDYVREHVYQPAGMTRTGSWPVDSLPPNTAIGYTRESGKDDDTAAVALHPNTALLPGRGSAAGGGYSTAPDLLQLLAAVHAQKIPGLYQGGLGVAGGAPGLNAALDSDLPGGYDLVVLANLDPPAAEAIARRVRAWLGASD